MPSVKKVTRSMESCLSKIVSISAIDDEERQENTEKNISLAMLIFANLKIDIINLRAKAGCACQQPVRRRPPKKINAVAVVVHRRKKR